MAKVISIYISKSEVKIKSMINEKHLAPDYWSDVTLKMSKGICCSFFFFLIAVEAGAILFLVRLHLDTKLLW